jgi:hypothetical protein
LSPEELEDLISAASRIAVAESFRSGLGYVDDASFWQWMSENYPGVAARPGGWAAWIQAKPKSAGSLLSGKVQEWDWVRDFKNKPINLAKLAHVSKDAVSRHDATVKNLLTGHVEKVESKFASSRGSAASALENAQRKPGIGRLVGTPEVIEEAHGRGLESHLQLEQYRSSGQGQEAAARRARSAPRASGPGVTLPGGLREVGRGALIGAAVSISASTIAQYRAWHRGQISADEFKKQVLHDAAKGGTKGAILGGINVGVQTAALAIGVGAPITIPVMLVFGIAIERIIDPAFGDGEYRRVLDRLGYQADLAALGSDFAVACQGAYDTVAIVAFNAATLRLEFEEVNALSAATTDRIGDALEKI